MKEINWPFENRVIPCLFNSKSHMLSQQRAVKLDYRDVFKYFISSTDKVHGFNLFFFAGPSVTMENQS